jgi:hypothetical protein
MGIVRVLGDEMGWSDKKIKRVEGILDLLFIALILFFGYLGVQQVMMINECKDVIKCRCPYAPQEEFGQNYTFNPDDFALTSESPSVISPVPD